MSQHDLTGLFGCGERFERRADDLHGRPVLINRTPRSYEAGIALKAATAAAHITDDEGKTVATRIPYLDVFDRSNDATELHDAPQKSPAPIKSWSCEGYVTAALSRLFDGAKSKASPDLPFAGFGGFTDAF